MPYTVLKYILWIMICLPFLAVMIFLVSRVLDEIISIKRNKKQLKEARSAEDDRRERFDIDYRARRGGGE